MIMKKILLSFIAMAMITLGFSQAQSPYPCLKTFTVSNLGNPPGCPSTYQGYIKTGLVLVSFTSAIPADVTSPDIIAFYNVNPDGSLGTQIDAKFVFRRFVSGTLTAEYCFYTQDGDNVISNGNNAKFKAKIQYAGYLPATCDIVESPPPSTLPVSFKSFTAARASSASVLKWTTATEINSKGFYVQRFYNGQWENLGFIATKAEAGNSSTDLNYTYNDVFNFKGVVQYRILQVDLDGKSKYSEVRCLSNSSQGGSILIYPNPAPVKGNVSIVLSDASSSYDIQIVDNSGRIVKEFTSVRSTQQVSNLPKGQYLARVKERESGQVSVDKFIVQ
jgi:hypothetical protein